MQRERDREKVLRTIHINLKASGLYGLFIKWYAQLYGCGSDEFDVDGKKGHTTIKLHNFINSSTSN